MFKLLKADTTFYFDHGLYRSKFTKYNHGAKCHEWCGVSYDLSGILKNGTNVKIAESKALEVQNSEMMLTDDIKIQVQKSH
jgi:hypothetical protein